MLILDNAMDRKLDWVGSGLWLKQNLVILNTDHIVKIKFKPTLFNRENNCCYVITLITGEKIYVNLKRAFVYGLFSVSYVDNPDFVKLERFFTGGNIFINK